MKVLHLNLMGKYWDEIKAGDKGHEYRLDTPYWRKRLLNRTYDAICLKRGYPKKGDKSKELWKKWNGFEIIGAFDHAHFGTEPVTVFAINVKEDLGK